MKSQFVVFQAQVLYDFTAEPGNNELSVRQGETVTVLDQVLTPTRPIYSIYTPCIQNTWQPRSHNVCAGVCADCGWRLDQSPGLQRTNWTGTWGIFTGELELQTTTEYEVLLLRVADVHGVFQVGNRGDGEGGGGSWSGGGAYVSNTTEGWDSRGYKHTQGNIMFYLTLKQFFSF